MRREKKYEAQTLFLHITVSLGGEALHVGFYSKFILDSHLQATMEHMHKKMSRFGVFCNHWHTMFVILKCYDCLFQEVAMYSKHS